MTEKPILFSGEMVRAILAGRKCQTRRIVKGSEDYHGVDLVQDSNDVYFARGWWSSDGATQTREVEPIVQPGGKLWVREAWRASAPWDHMNARQIANSAHDNGYSATAKHPPCGLWYEADGFYRRWGTIDNEPGRYRHARFMPRWASRLTLKVYSVRVEQLHDLTRGDAMAEGCPFANMAKGPDPRDWFADLWQRINGVDAWDANPWVWVYKFKREKQP